MPARVRIIHRRVEDIGIAVVALRIPRVRHNGIGADKPRHLRQVIARIHVDQPQVVAGVVHPVAGIAPVADSGIDARRRVGVVHIRRLHLADGVVIGADWKWYAVRVAPQPDSALIE